MGEVIDFPGSRGRDVDHEPAERSDPSVTGRRPALLRPEAPEAVAAPRESAGEARWAVPVIDSGETPVAPAPAPPREGRQSQRASNVATAALARHDASEGEVRSRLVARGLEQDDVEAELQRLRSVGLLDDAAFAARLVASLRERKGLGDGAIRSTLRSRLVPPGVVDAVLAEQAEDEGVAQDRLQAVADDRARRLAALSREVAERRLIAYLMRRGYGGGAVHAAARRALESAGLR